MNGERASRVAIVALLVIGVASLLAGFAASIFAEPAPRVASAGADAFSTSAIGHRACVELLGAAGHRITIARGGAGARAAREDALLCLLEPTADPDELAAELGRADRVLLVLPKWRGEVDPDREHWLRAVSPVPAAELAQVLEAAGIAGEIVRGEDPFRAVVDDLALGSPAIDRPQTLRGGSLEVRCGDERGLLLGVDRRADREIWVLTDPDALQNHGLRDERNAAFVLGLFDELAPDGGRIVIDEGSHGHVVPASIWQVLGRFPLVLVLVQGLLAVAAMLWAGAGRFGAPWPIATELRAGRLLLIERTAALLLRARRSAAVLERYLDHEEARVARARHVPRHLDAAQRRRALATIEAGRPVARTIDELDRDLRRARQPGPGHEHRLLHAARAIHRWRQEMLDGTR